MKKYLLGLFLVTLTIIYSTPIIATAVTGDPNDAFGNVEVAQPVKDQTVSPTDKLSVVWNMANEKMSKLIAKKRYVFFRVTLVQEPTCADLTTCPPQKYELTNGKKYTRATDLSYSYDVATLPAGITGRYRVAVCYQVYAGQRLSKLLARTRCGASATFNF
ncbi:MAG: hypothetical protein NT041_02630, partial [Candidatus Vogelbacteria bacterium]|nr:hypothetical protein [Candidatus Vogelbacteria bacterium]